MHISLAYVIKRQLSPQLAPKYFARLEKYVVTDTDPQVNLGIVYPDLDVWEKPSNILREPGVAERREAAIALIPPTITLRSPIRLEVNIPIIEILDKAENRLVTTIEILSPVNKQQPGFEKYEEKQQGLQ